MTEVKGTIEKIFTKLEAFLQRPSWLVCTVMSTLTAIVGAETMFILYSYLVRKG